jgi:pilus assembly protein Flp/PilA
MTRVLQALFANESAATAIEYGLVAGGVAIAIITAISRTGGTLNNFFVTLSAAL